MNPGSELAAYLSKATRTLAAARLLLRNENPEGACNRAYYAMFNAAYAALIGIRVEGPASRYKTHNSLVAAFGQHLVLGAHVDPELGRALNKVQRIRQVADYVGDPISLDDAVWAVEQAEAFVAVIKAKFAEQVRIARVDPSLEGP